MYSQTDLRHTCDRGGIHVGFIADVPLVIPKSGHEDVRDTFYCLKLGQSTSPVPPDVIVQAKPDSSAEPTQKPVTGYVALMLQASDSQPGSFEPVGILCIWNLESERW
jgi:hypothetical protein